MKPLRNGDLSEIPGAAELIDSAQDAAKTLARCCAAKDAEIDRLREEFGRAVDRITEAWLGHDANKMDEAILAAQKIAREGR